MEDQRGSHEKEAERKGNYNAPLVAPNITRNVLEAFGEPAYASRLHCDEERVTYSIKDRHGSSDAGEVLITLKEHEGMNPELAVYGTLGPGSGISMEIRGPVSDWLLAQTVDDHNLLTELVYQREPALSIYGPPAKIVVDDINICGDGNGGVLIPKEHRR